MKYRIIYGTRFLNAVKCLEKAVKVKLDNQLSILSEDPFHPRLHTKPLSGALKGTYSFRVGRDYRIIFIFLAKDAIQLFLVAHRKDIYR